MLLGLLRLPSDVLRSFPFLLAPTVEVELRKMAAVKDAGHNSLLFPGEPELLSRKPSNYRCSRRPSASRQRMIPDTLSLRTNGLGKPLHLRGIRRRAASLGVR